MINFSFRKNAKFEIDSLNRIVSIRFIGETYSSDIMKINKQLVNSQNQIKGYNWIFDLSKSKLLFTVEQIGPINTIFKDNSELFQNIKMAIIIRSPKQSLGVDSLVNYFKANHINITIKKVIDIKHAYAWIVEGKY
jgi:hypothetical protein